MNQLGYYGKTPHRGDFVRFNLPQSFLKVWDDWLLQVMIHGETHCTDWATVYEQAPGWRFVLSSGMAGSTPWIGVFRPSRDKVGRRFPFCLAMSLAEETLPCITAATQMAWFEEADALLNRALSQDYDFDDLQGEMAMMTARQETATLEVASPVSLSSKQSADDVTVTMMSSTALDSSRALTALLDTVLQQTLGVYSIWITNSASTVEATVINAGLPADKAGIALFNADWTEASTARIDPALLAGLTIPTASSPGSALEEPTILTGEDASASVMAAAEPASPMAVEPDLPGDDDIPVAIPVDTQNDSSTAGADVAPTEQVPSDDDWAALEDFVDRPATSSRVIVPEAEPLELDEDNLPDAPWEN